MALDIVLVRHGDAEPRQPGVEDRFRKLTPEGISALKRAYPATFSLVRCAPLMQMWVSSAERARQTASIIQSVTGVEELVLSQILMNQDIDEFVRALSETDLDVVIAVGHIPSQERVCERLCGVKLAFAPGAAACIRIDDQARRHIARASVPLGKLQWFVQGPSLEPGAIVQE